MHSGIWDQGIRDHHDFKTAAGKLVVLLTKQGFLNHTDNFFQNFPN